MDKFDELLYLIMEHGGAHKRVFDLMAKKQEELNKKADEEKDPIEKKRLKQQAHNLSNKYLTYSNSRRYNNSTSKTDKELLSGNFKSDHGKDGGEKWDDGDIHVNIKKDLEARRRAEKNLRYMNRDQARDYKVGKSYMKQDFVRNGEKKILQKYDTSVLKLNRKEKDKSNDEEFDDVLYDESFGSENSLIREYYEVVGNLQRDLNNNSMSYEVADQINDAAYERYVKNNNPKDIMEYLLHDFDLKEKENYEIAIESFHQYKDGNLSKELFDLFLEYLEIDNLLGEYVSEAETDYDTHMKKKETAAYHLGKNVGELKNKKYGKNEEQDRKADLKYKYEDSMKNNKHTTEHFNSISNVNVMVTKDTPKESDMKLLQYMQAHSDLSDPSESKKYKAAFKMFCTKFGIKPNSSLYVKFDPDNNGKDRMKLVEWPESKKISREDLEKKKEEVGDKIKNSVEKKYLLPDGYCLIHKRNSSGLKFVSPKKVSQNYINGGDSGRGGQYHSTGRVYFVLQKEDSLPKDNGNWGKGNCLYKLVSKVSGFYIDYEEAHQRGADRYDSIDKLVGKPVYVKTDKPLKVVQIQ